MRRSSAISCRKEIELPEEFRETPGMVKMFCCKQENIAGSIIPDEVGVFPHLQADREGHKNICMSSVCVYNPILGPGSNPSYIRSEEYLFGKKK